MKIEDFKIGDLITRTAKPVKYVSTPDFIGDCFMFYGVCNNHIYLKYIFGEWGESYQLTITTWNLIDFDDDKWTHFKVPMFMMSRFLIILNIDMKKAINNKDKYNSELLENVIVKLKNYKY